MMTAKEEEALKKALKIVRVAVNDVEDAFGDVHAKKLHIQGTIPNHKLINAKKGMGISEPVSDILCLYDACVIFSPGDTGFAIVPTGIYIRAEAEEPMFFRWKEINVVRLSWGSLKINNYCGPTIWAGQDEKFVSAIKSLVWVGARKSL